MLHASATGDRMKRMQKSVLLGLALAVPVAAQAFLPQKQLCFAAGAGAYQLSASARVPDFKVRIDNRAAHPDLRMQLVDDPTTADFVLVDDLDAADNDACHTSGPLKTIRVDGDEKRPDLTINLAADSEAADFKLYVRSARFSREDAAALFGVMWRASRLRDLAERH
jgi:hypothetical protein